MHISRIDEAISGFEELLNQQYVLRTSVHEYLKRALLY